MMPRDGVGCGTHQGLGHSPATVGSMARWRPTQPRLHGHLPARHERNPAAPWLPRPGLGLAWRGCVQGTAGNVCPPANPRPGQWCRAGVGRFESRGAFYAAQLLPRALSTTWAPRATQRSWALGHAARRSLPSVGSAIVSECRAYSLAYSHGWLFLVERELQLTHRTVGVSLEPPLDAVPVEALVVPAGQEVETLATLTEAQLVVADPTLGRGLLARG